MVGTHEWLYAHYIHSRRHIESVYQRTYNCLCSYNLGTHKWLYAHYTHPDVILNQFINVPLIDGWGAHMTLCSLHPPRRHVESVFQRSYNWWLGTHKWLYAHYWISLSTQHVMLHPPRRHIESVYQRSYNWWLERTNDSMLITPTQTSYWISLSTFL